MPKFGELTETNSPLDDQNFIQIQHALANISFNTKFSNQLKRLFPNYQTLNGPLSTNFNVFRLYGQTRIIKMVEHHKIM